MSREQYSNQNEKKSKRNSKKSKNQKKKKETGSDDDEQIQRAIKMSLETSKRQRPLHEPSSNISKSKKTRNGYFDEENEGKHGGISVGEGDDDDEKTQEIPSVSIDEDNSSNNNNIRNNNIRFASDEDIEDDDSVHAYLPPSAPTRISSAASTSSATAASPLHPHYQPPIPPPSLKNADTRLDSISTPIARRPGSARVSEKQKRPYDETTPPQSNNNNHHQGHQNNINNLQGSSTTPGTASYPISVEEDELERAIRESIITASNSATSRLPTLVGNGNHSVESAVDLDLNQNPNSFITPINSKESLIERKRLESCPVGLKNLGNTCYLNSLIQTWFMIPSFRRRILTLNFKDFASKQNEKTLDFLHQLQRLFSYLIMTNQSFIDPSPIIHQLKVCTSLSMNLTLGSQQDVSEFNDIFLDILERGFACLFPGNENFIRQAFYGKSIEFTDALESDSSQIEVENKNEFCHLMLPVSHSLNNIYASFDAMTEFSIDEFRTEKGYMTNARKTQWFEKLPPILLLHLQRFDFDKKDQTLKKINSPFHFEKEIILDRYFLENRSSTENKRDLARKLKEEIRHIDTKLEDFFNYKKTNTGILESLKTTISFLQETEIHNEELIQALSKRYDAVEHSIDELKNQRANLEMKIASLYDDQPRTRRFLLHSIWIHSGASGSGHYWSFTLYHSKNEWLKFNDINVTHVSEEQVLKDSIGIEGGLTSAYFLIYIDPENESKTIDSHLADPELIPSEIKAEIEKENEALDAALEEASNPAETAPEPSNVMKLIAAVSSKSFTVDNQIMPLDAVMLNLDFYDILKIRGRGQLWRARFLKDSYPLFLHRDIVEDLGSSSLFELGQALQSQSIDLETIVQTILDDETESTTIYNQNFLQRLEVFSILIQFFKIIIDRKSSKLWGPLCYDIFVRITYGFMDMERKLMMTFLAQLLIAGVFYASDLFQRSKPLTASRLLHGIISTTILIINDCRNHKNMFLDLFEKNVFPFLRENILLLLASNNDPKSLKINTTGNSDFESIVSEIRMCCEQAPENHQLKNDLNRNNGFDPLWIHEADKMKKQLPNSLTRMEVKQVEDAVEFFYKEFHERLEGTQFGMRIKFLGKF